jgi:ADP-ribose pyrophosphatase
MRAKGAAVAVVYNGPVFSVEESRMRFPNGSEHDVSVVRHPPSVVIIPLKDRDHVILIRQYRPSIAREIWELPAGSMDHGETAEAAAMRECEEEIGLVPRRVERLRGLFPAPGFCDEELIFCRASDLQPPPADSQHRPDEDEYIEATVFSIDEARAMAARGEIIDLKSAYGLTLI